MTKSCPRTEQYLPTNAFDFAIRSREFLRGNFFLTAHGEQDFYIFEVEKKHGYTRFDLKRCTKNEIQDSLSKA